MITDLPNKAELIEDAIERAILFDQVLVFRYFKSPHNSQERTFSPYELRDGKVIGWDHHREGIRLFELSKIAWPIEINDTEDYVQPIERN